MNIVSLLVLYVIYFLEVDLSGFRGLNFIRGNDGDIHRFFVETSAFYLISDFQRLRNSVLRCLFWMATLFYFVFIAKITLLIVLFISLYFLKWFRLWPIITSFVGGGALLFFFDSGYYVYFIREDLILSVLFKVDQFKEIIANFNLSHLMYGSGFGFYLSEFVTDISQPYQIEMQLPMLVLQIGLLNVLLIIIGFYFLFKSILAKRAVVGLFLFLSVGFINPWLFLPVWFISVSFYTKFI
jgi:hypothetical protein